MTTLIGMALYGCGLYAGLLISRTHGLWMLPVAVATAIFWMMPA